MPFKHMHDVRALAAALERSWPERMDALRASGVPLNMPYDNVIVRAEVPMPENVLDTFRSNLVNVSTVLSTFTRVPVSGGSNRFPVLSALPVAYWVAGDTGLKQTSEAAWSNKFLNIEELAVIVPVPEAVLDDANFDIWEEIRPLLENAGGRLIDSTVFFGANAPATFPTNVVAAAIAAGNTVNRGTNVATAGGLVGDIGTLLGSLELDGFDANAGVAGRGLRGFARQARNSQGDRFPEVQVNEGSVDIDSVRFITDSMRGQWPSGSGSAEAIAFDRSEFVVGVRRDFTFKILDQAVIQDAQGNIVFNLAQQDMVAMRMVMRVGWQVANTINYDQVVEANRYPAAVLRTP